MTDLTRRTAREVLDEHLGLANRWAEDLTIDEIMDADLRRNAAEDVVILFDGGEHHGHGGARALAARLAEELPDHAAFTYTNVATAGRMGFLEWTYEDSQVVVRDGADSYLIENGRIVAMTIHYTVERRQAPVPTG